ncbi:MAG TPA: ATP-binding cassette domain-containing protein, partial [Acidimicrobiia bacterium]|nr:ATP-binding cassette domain-containing protein [Acidimicrobiia bacterium]
MSEGSAVEVEHVAKTFAGRRVAVLEDVSFRVRPGELTVLVGPSGSGKTTTLNLIGALDRTDRGRINVFGHDVTGRRHLDRYRRG